MNSAPDPTTAEARAELSEADKVNLLLACNYNDDGEHLFAVVEALFAARLAPASGLAAGVEALANEWQGIADKDWRQGQRTIFAAAAVDRLRALLADHPAPVPDQQAVADDWHDEWCDANGCRCGKCPCSCGYAERALATGQGPDTGGEA